MPNSKLPTAGTTIAVSLPGPVGPLEGLLSAPRAAPQGLCVVCHPHPLYGGTMTNKVAYTLAAAALELGFLSLRFNFRGVGRSAGQHDAGRGEVEDVVATVDWLRTRGDGPLLLAGFSFGAQMALRAAAQRPPAWLVTVGTPGPQYLAGPDPAVPQCPWLAVHGEEDEVVDCATTRDWLASLSPPPRFESVPDTGHFFHRRLVDLRQRVVAFLASHGAGR